MGQVAKIIVFAVFILFCNSQQLVFGSNDLVSSITISGAIEATNTFENKDLKTGEIIRRQVFVVVRLSNRDLIIVDVSMIPAAKYNLNQGMTVTITGNKRQISSDQISKLEKRLGKHLLSENEKQTLSTAFRVISLLWRNGSIQAGERPPQVTWIEAY